MKLRAASVLLAFTFAFISLPAHAQGPGGPPPNYQQLVSQLAALTARVAKLEGQITSADLVGTYLIGGIQTRVFGGGGASIASGAVTGTLILNADFSGSLQINGNGSLLSEDSLSSWSIVPYTLGNGNPGVVFPLTWAYANGAITVTIGGNTGSMAVGPGGRLLVATIAEFSPVRADAGLLIFYRPLQ